MNEGKSDPVLDLDPDGESFRSDGSNSQNFNSIWSSALRHLKNTIHCCLFGDDATMMMMATAMVARKQEVDCALQSMVSLLRELDLFEQDSHYRVYADQLCAVFQNTSFPEETAIDSFSLLCELLNKISSTNTWLAPLFTKIVVILLFQFQFISGSPLKETALVAENKLFCVGHCLETFRLLLLAGRSLTANSWQLLEEYMLEQSDLTSKCSRSLISFRLFYLRELFELFLSAHGSTSRVVSSLVILCTLSESLDRAKEGKFDGTVYLLPVQDSQGIVFPLQKDKFVSYYRRSKRNNQKQEQFYGAGYWNDKVLSQYFEEKESDAENHLSASFLTSPVAKIIYQKFLHYNQQLISCKYSLLESYIRWMGNILQDKAAVPPVRSSPLTAPIMLLRHRFCLHLYHDYVKSLKAQCKHLRRKLTSRSIQKPESFPTLFIDNESSSAIVSTGQEVFEREERVVQLSYIVLFSLITKANQRYLEDISLSLLELIEKESEKEIYRTALVVNVLRFFLSHCCYQIAGDWKTECTHRLLRWLDRIIQQERKNTGLVVSRYCKYCIQTMFYVLIHRVHCAVDYNDRTNHQESMIVDDAGNANMQLLLREIVASHHTLLLQCFTYAQWIYLRLFILPHYSIGSREDVVLELLQGDNRKELGKELVSEHRTALRESLLFRCSPANVIERLLTLSDDPTSSVYQSLLFQRWRCQFPEQVVPSIHTFTYSHLSLYLLHCQQLLLPAIQPVPQYMRKRTIARQAVDDDLNYFEALSGEVLLHVFSYLNYKRIVKMTQVNRQCRHLIVSRPIFWKEIYFRSFPKHQFLEEFLSNHSHQTESGSVISFSSSQRTVTKIPQCPQCTASLQREQLPSPSKRQVTKGRACRKRDCQHVWCSLFKAQIIALTKAKRKAEASARLCPIIGCTAVFASKGEEDQGKTFAYPPNSSQLVVFVETSSVFRSWLAESV